MSYKISKHKQEHIQVVAQQYGLSSVTVDAVITAYVADMCDALRSGNNVNIPHLVTVGVKPDGYGGYSTYSAVSKVLRKELHGKETPVHTKITEQTKQLKQTEQAEHSELSEQSKKATILTSPLLNVGLGIPGLTLGG